MLNRVIAIFLIVIIITRMHSLEMFFLVSISAGGFLKNQDLTFIQSFIYALIASIIAFLILPLYVPALELFGNVFGDISAATLVVLSILFTTFTCSLLMKTTHELLNWNKSS